MGEHILQSESPEVAARNRVVVESTLVECVVPVRLDDGALALSLRPLAPTIERGPLLGQQCIPKVLYIVHPEALDTANGGRPFTTLSRSAHQTHVACPARARCLIKFPLTLPPLDDDDDDDEFIRAWSSSRARVADMSPAGLVGNLIFTLRRPSADTALHA